MEKSSKQAAPDWVLRDSDLPILPELARKPPVLTMDEYFRLNDEDPDLITRTPITERCQAVFDL
jgi:hypothetical protein